MSKKRIVIEVDSGTKRIVLFDAETSQYFELHSIMILGGGKKPDGGGLLSVRLMYGNSNAFADIFEDQVFDSAVEGQQKQNYDEHIAFHKMYLGILAGIFKALLLKIPIPFPKHPNEVAPEELLERWEEEEKSKRDSAAKKWPEFNTPKDTKH